MYPEILSFSEVNSLSREMEFDHGYEKLIEIGGKSVNLTLQVSVASLSWPPTPHPKTNKTK